MSRLRKSRALCGRPLNFRSGFTLVELLIVIAIISALVALLLPAVQAARESARRATCENNLKQYLLGVHSYHEAHHLLPPLYNGPQKLTRGATIGLDTFSWQTMVLPYIEQGALQKEFDYTRYATDVVNQSGVTKLLLIASCPSTPRTSLVARGLWFERGQFNEKLSAATTDYASSEGYLDGLVDCVPGAWGELVPGSGYFDSPKVRKVGFAQITDGLSNTTLILERAGLPDHYFASGTKFEPHEPPTFRTWGNVGLWAISAEMLLNHLQLDTGMPVVNGDNLHGLYSFHPNGVDVAFADNSVRFIGASIDAKVMLALVSRDGDEVIDHSAIP